MVTIQLPGAFHGFLQKNVIENSLFTIAYINCNFKLIKTKLFKGQLQRFHKVSLFDRFRHAENGLDINF